MQKLTRRRFIALCGMAVPGIWLAGTGLVRLPARMVFAMSGSCSFCAKAAHELFGLAGVTGTNVRVCSECIDVCFEILRDDPWRKHPAPPREEVVERVVSDGLPNERSFSQQLSDRVAAGERGDPLVEALAKALNLGSEDLVLEPPEPPPYACSFCNKSEEQGAKLIAGPTVFICDVCVGDAGSLFMRYGWRPEVGLLRRKY